MTAVQRQTAVTAYFISMLFVFELQDSLLPSSNGILTAVQRQTAVTAYLTSKQLALFYFTWILCSYCLDEQRFPWIYRSGVVPSKQKNMCITFVQR